MSDTIDKPEVRTERLNLLVTPEEKRRFEAKARSAGLSVSELLRRAADFYEPDVDFEELELLAAAMSDMADRLLPKIDATLARMKAREDALPDLQKKWRAEALEEIERNGYRWPFGSADQAASK